LTEINIILSILETLKENKPDSVFINSLHHQFCNRGGLSKKQLEGLHAKAVQSNLISTAKLATLEAIIKKKPTRYKSEKIKTVVIEKKDEAVLQLLEEILNRFPQHKMVLFLHSKYKHNDILTDAEIAEAKRLHKVLLK
jgi:hypothetical protein